MNTMLTRVYPITLLLALAWSLVALVSLLYPLYADAPPGTDWYYECTTGAELDLTPTIQDEADTTLSTERN